MKRSSAGNRRWRVGAVAAVAAMAVYAFTTTVASAAGTLTPKGSPNAAIQIRSHHANVVINNGFAMTEVTQTFFNPNGQDLEAICSCPLPKEASLSEMTIWAGETELNGEVVAKDEADRIYEEEKQKGNDAGKAEKNSFQTFDFYVARVPAQSETRVRYVYYQPLKIDTGVGRYLYPLEPGGTDEQAEAFWTQNKKVDGQFSVHVELKSAHPLVDVRVPTYSSIAQVQQVDEGTYTIDMTTQDASLDRDFIVYYRLADDLPLFAASRPIAAEPPSPVLEALADIELDELSPRQALELLYRLKSLADGED